jgi:hypothetical protein
MIYLSGVTNDRIEPSLIQTGVGLMCQPGNSYHLRIERFSYWAADNGCFNDKWVEDKWIDWLAALPREKCLFAVAPDIYPDAVGSLERGRAFAPIIREMGFPVAIVAQTDAEKLDWPWDEFDCLFVGGERKIPGWSEWKESDAAAELVKRARSNGLWVHMGRVNSLRRLQRARQVGCHSVDGTFIKYRKRRLASDRLDSARHDRGEKEIERFLRVLDNTPPLPFDRFESPSHPAHKAALRA